MRSDLEDQKGEPTTFYTAEISSNNSSSASDSAKPTGILGRLQRYEAVLDRKLGVEAQGPERVLPENRNPPNQLLMALVWASGTMNLSCFATGFLGFDFGLSLKQSVLITIFGTLLGAMVTVSSGGGGRGAPSTNTDRIMLILYLGMVRYLGTGDGVEAGVDCAI